MLKLADGRIVNPDGTISDPAEEKRKQEKVDNLIVLAAESAARSLAVTVQRKLADLPAEPRIMNSVGVVLAYSLFGLAEADIALATGMTEAQVATIRNHDAYLKMHETIVVGITDAEVDNVRQMIMSHSRAAVSEIVNVLKTSESEGNRLVAAKDILDRSGHRPADVVEHRHKMDGGLTIEIIHKDKRNEIPTIELEAETVQ